MMLEINDDEIPFIHRILRDPRSFAERIDYANWLKEKGDPRGDFISTFVEAMENMELNKFPISKGLDQSWLDLIGFTIMHKLASFDQALKYRDPIFKLVEAAILIETTPQEDTNIEIGVSKYGGEPDFPNDSVWPVGEQCDATYNDDTKGVKELAGFLMQIELSDAQSSPFVELPLPLNGLLSFFCYQDEENIDCIGVKAFHFDQLSDLQRLSPPSELAETNSLQAPQKLRFRETLRVKPNVGTGDEQLDDIIWDLRCELIDNQTLFGVNDYQTDEIHFIGINKDSSTTVFIDVSEDISKTSLSWVEFDGASGFL